MMNTHDGHLSLNFYLRILRQFQATAAVQLSDEKNTSQRCSRHFWTWSIFKYRSTFSSNLSDAKKTELSETFLSEKKRI